MRKSNISKHHILYIVPITLSLFSQVFISIANTSALSYSSNTNVQFTFNPTISISISGNLSIDELSPGNASDSNIADVIVSTNNISGYTLTATVGTNNTTTNDKLTNISNSGYYFTNLTSNISDIASFNDNTWGYSYSTDNGTTWISGDSGNTSTGYNGLPLDTNTTSTTNNGSNTNTTSDLGKGGVTLIDTYNAADSTIIKFKIGAKASITQASGTYNNTVNFYTISKVPPISITDAFMAASTTNPSIITHNGYYAMQDMSPTICNMTQTIDEDSQTELIDIRDNKVYWIAKLQDGHCWMTQNLDLDLISGQPLTSETTNLTTYGTAPYIEGYTSENGIISWTPMDWMSTPSTGSKTVSATTRTPNSSGGFDDWVNGVDTEGADQYKDGYIHPLSADPGDWYQKGTYSISANCNYLLNACPNITSAVDNVNGKHGHLGNYYGFTTAAASNNTNGVTYGYQANSICSSNWRLPENGEYAVLNNLYNDGIISDANHESDKELLNAPLYFTRAGGVNHGSIHSAYSLGMYWHGNLNSTQKAISLNINSDNITLLSFPNRWYGFPLRCLAK